MDCAPQIGAAIALIKRKGGSITHSELLIELGYEYDDPRGSNIIKKIAYRLRGTVVKNERGVLSMEIPDSASTEALEFAIKDALKGAEKVSANTRLALFTAIAFILGFIFAFFFVETEFEIINDLNSLPLCLTENL